MAPVSELLTALLNYLSVTDASSKSSEGSPAISSYVSNSNDRQETLETGPRSGAVFQYTPSVLGQTLFWSIGQL